MNPVKSSRKKNLSAYNSVNEILQNTQNNTKWQIFRLKDIQANIGTILYLDASNAIKSCQINSFSQCFSPYLAIHCSAISMSSWFQKHESFGHVCHDVCLQIDLIKYQTFGSFPLRITNLIRLKYETPINYYIFPKTHMDYFYVNIDPNIKFHTKTQTALMANLKSENILLYIQSNRGLQLFNYLVSMKTLP